MTGQMSDESEKQSPLAAEMSREEMVKLAADLVHYFRNSYRIRMVGLAYNIRGIDPPIVTELINFIRWNGGMGVIDAAEHSLALSNVVHESQNELRQLVEQARVADDARPFLLIAQKIQKQAEAASHLLSVLAEGDEEE